VRVVADHPHVEREVPGIELGQLDDFSTLSSWQRGSLATPGPAGEGDVFLRIDSDGVSQGGGWILARFSIGPSDLVLTNGSAGYASVMGGVVTLRVLHASSPAAIGEPLIGSLGIDSIRTLGADTDADDWADESDNCPVFANTDQADVDQNGIGDLCECGDQDQDGTVSVSDLVAINLAIFHPARITPLCDTTADDLCDVRDISGANLKLFGQPGYCSRWPPPVP
jgi:hypothetical protein